MSTKASVSAREAFEIRQKQCNTITKERLNSVDKKPTSLYAIITKNSLTLLRCKNVVTISKQKKQAAKLKERVQLYSSLYIDRIWITSVSTKTTNTRLHCLIMEKFKIQKPFQNQIFLNFCPRRKLKPATQYMSTMNNQIRGSTYQWHCNDSDECSQVSKDVWRVH